MPGRNRPNNLTLAALSEGGKRRSDALGVILSKTSRDELISILLDVDKKLVAKDLGSVIMSRTAPPCQRISARKKDRH